MMNTVGTETGRSSSTEASISNIPKNAVTYGRRMAGKSHLASGWIERLNAGHKKPERVVTDLQRNHDTYRLTDALRPSELMLHLANAGIVMAPPVLCTYHGDQTSAVVKHMIYP